MVNELPKSVQKAKANKSFEYIQMSGCKSITVNPPGNPPSITVRAMKTLLCFICLCGMATAATDNSADVQVVSAYESESDLVQEGYAVCSDAAKVTWCARLAVGWTQVIAAGRVTTKTRRLRLVRNAGQFAAHGVAANFSNSFDSASICQLHGCDELGKIIEGHIDNNTPDEPWATSYHRESAFTGTLTNNSIDLHLSKILTERDCTPDEKATETAACNAGRRRRRRKKRNACAQVPCFKYTVAKSCSLLPQSHDVDQWKIDTMSNLGIRQECSIL